MTILFDTNWMPVDVPESRVRDFLAKGYRAPDSPDIMDATECSQIVDKILRMYSPDYDWEEWWREEEEEPSEMFRQVVRVIDRLGSTPFLECGYFNCGDVTLDDAPKGLYRLLFLSQPRSVDFSRLYQSGCLFLLSSRCHRFAASVETSDYRLILRFYCKKEDLREEEGGAPNVDPEVKCSNPDGISFFEMLQKSANRTWEGNTLAHFVC
jgi:hypothetical protein